MKTDKVLFVFLFLFLIYVLILPPSVIAHDSDPQDTVIRQVLTTSFQDLGYNNVPPIDLSYLEIDGSWRYALFDYYEEDPPVVIEIFAYSTEQAAVAGLDSWRSDFQSRNGNEFLSTTFHGNPAWYYEESYAESTYSSSRIVWQSGRFWFYTYAHPSGRLEPSAEVVYTNAQKYGLLTSGTVTQDSDGDGVNDDLDRCLNTPAGITVDADGCPVEINLIMATDKSNYVPGENVIISGSVDINGTPMAGADITLNINNQTTNVDSDKDGNYNLTLTIPANTTIFFYQVSATVNHPAYQSVTRQTTFTVGRDMNIAITHDKDYYLIGDPVHCTITLKDDAGDPVPYADLTVTTTHLGSGRIETFNGQSDAFGENLWDFIWGKDAAGKTISEGKLKIEVNASKDGYDAGSASITLSGCGDLVHNDGEDCFICPEDCACGPNEVCDPSSDYKDIETMCSPKVACIFISNGLSWYEKWWAADDIRGIRKKYRKLGYKLTPNIYVDDINDVAKYLSRPSTKAIAYAGHGPEAGKPAIETVVSDNIPSMIIMSNRSAGSFLYRCRYEIYADKWADLQDRIEAAASAKVNHPDLDYVFMFSCYSLDNFSLRNYLLKSGGTYWGYRGKLPGYATLSKSIKP